MTEHLLQFKQIGINRSVALYGPKQIPCGMIFDQPYGVSWNFQAGAVKIGMRHASDMEAARAAILAHLLEFLLWPQGSSARVLEHADSTRQECRE